MNRIGFLKFVLAFVIWGTASQSCSKDNDGQQLPPIYDDNKSLEEQLEAAEWEIKEIADGITWKYFHFAGLIGSQQSVTLFEIDPKKAQFEIEHVTSGFLKTSDAASDAGATVAFNGSYFDTTNGGSTVFYRQGGTIINETRAGFTPYRENAALSIDGEKIGIHKKPSGGWNTLSSSTVLAGGPLLVFEGEEVSQVNQAFNTNRHPRTAVGVTSSGKVIVAVIDGRSSQSHGLSTIDLAALMHALGCTDAMNLDGGGSSTAWITNEGVVNYPTDNGQFDHEGERGVATVVTVGAQ